MIQLTKGTNVLDINLSDFSGAGQDVVQNGSFTDIGADLVKNGDFAQIGSELITNGDFSAVGSNLVTNPNFTDGVSRIENGDFLDYTVGGSFGIDIADWKQNAASGSTTYTKTAEGIKFIIDTAPTNNWDVRLYSGVGNVPLAVTDGKSYRVRYSVKGYSSSGIFYAKMSWLNGTNNLVGTTSGDTFNDTTWTDIDEYIVASNTSGANPSDGQYLQFWSQDAAVGDWMEIKDVFVEELGGDWDKFADVFPVYNASGVTLNTANGVAQIIIQENVVTSSKSYKVTYTISAASYTSGSTLKYYDGDSYENLPEQGVGTHTFYYTSTSGINDRWYFNLTTGSGTDEVTISSIVVQELGEGWSVGTGWSIGEDKASVDASVTASLSQGSLSVVAGKSYKISGEIYDYESGELQIEFGGGVPSIVGNVAADGVFTFYGKWDSGTILYLYALNTSKFSVSNVTLKEVGQDWTVANTDSTHYVEFFGGVGGARYVSDTTSPILTLTANGITLLAGKHYKLIVDVTVVTGSVKYDVTGTTILFDTTEVKTAYFSPVSDVGLSFYRGSSNVDVTFNSISVQQLDTNGRWVTFADPDSKSVMKLGQVDLEIDSAGKECGVYQTGLIKPNKLYIITINMKATEAINVEIAASLGTQISEVISTTQLTTEYKEYSFEYVTPFAVNHDLLIHRLFGSGGSQTISIDYVSMNGVDESKWINDPTWNPFATSLVYVPTLTDESTNNSKQFTLDTSIPDGGWDGRCLHGQVIINQFPTEVPQLGIITLEQPNFLEGFYQIEIRGYLGTFYRILGKGMAHLERASGEDGYNRFESYNDTVTYKAYEE